MRVPAVFWQIKHRTIINGVARQLTLTLSSCLNVCSLIPLLTHRTQSPHHPQIQIPPDVPAVAKVRMLRLRS